jgi:hypothetical protein
VPIPRPDRGDSGVAARDFPRGERAGGGGEEGGKSRVRIETASPPVHPLPLSSGIRPVGRQFPKRRRRHAKLAFSLAWRGLGNGECAGPG